MKPWTAGALLSLGLAASAQVNNDFRPATGVYSTVANWTLNALPASNNVVRFGVTNNQAVTHTGSVYAAGPLFLGTVSGRTASLTVNAGQLSFGGASALASNGANGTLILAGGTVIVTGQLTVGRAITNGATVGAITNNSGTLRVEGDLRLAGQDGGGGVTRGFLTVNGGTVTITNRLITANAAAFSYVALNGGVLEVGAITNGGSAGARDTRFNGGTLRALRDEPNFLPVTSFGTQPSNLVQNGGAVIDSQGFAITIATPLLRDGTATGGLTKIGAGTLNLAANNTYLGPTVVSQGVLRLLTGGRLGNNLSNRVTVAAGATFVISNVNAIAGNHDAPCLTPVAVNGGLLVGEKESRMGPIALNGGTLLANGGHALYGTFLLADTVTVAGAAASVITNTATANGKFPLSSSNYPTVFLVDDVTSNAAADLLVYAPLANAAWKAVGSGLYKAGPGTMWLGAVNSYTGETTVAAGTLAVAAGGSIGASTTLTVQAGATLDHTGATLTLGAGQALRGSGLVTGNVAVGATSQLRAGGVNTPGTLTVAGNLTLDSAYESVFDLTNSTAVGGGTNDLVVVTGDLDAGLGTIRINPLAPLVSGTYRLMEYAGTEPLPFSGGLVGLNTRDTAVLDETTPGQVNLNVTAGAAQALAWNPAVDGNWDYGTQNWLDAATRSATEQFYDLDTVLFDDAGAFNNVVNVTTNLRPAAIYVTGGSNYTFSGAGTLSNSAAGPLVIGKDGPGTLTLAQANGFTGGIVVSNGTLAAGAANALGSGAVTLLDGTTLSAAGGNQTVNNALALGGATAGLNDGGNVLTLNGAITGAAAVTKSGAGVVQVAGAIVTYTGPTRVSEGTLRLQNTTAFASPLTVDPNAVLQIDTATGFVLPAVAGVTLSNGTILTTITTSSADLNGPLTVQADSRILVSNVTHHLRPSGGLYGSNVTLTIERYAGKSGSVQFRGSNGAFFGALVVTNADINIADGALGTFSNATVTLQGASVLEQGNFTAGNSILIKSLNGSTGTVESANRSTTLIVGTADGSGSYAGRLINGPGAGALLSLTKVGSGTQTLAGENALSGTVTVAAGTLALGVGSFPSNASVVAVSNGAVLDVTLSLATLKAAQTLRGGGTVVGDVLAGAAARLVPGTGGPGGTRETLTLTGNLGLAATATNFFNLGSSTNAGGGFNDLVAITGNLEPSGSVVRIDVEQPLTNGVYRLFTYSGSKVTTFNPAPSFNGLPLGRRTAVLDESVANQINLNVGGTGPADLVWLPQTNGLWNLADNNWSNEATAAVEAFIHNDNVWFDERGAYSNVVTLTTTVQPTLVTVAGVSNYVFQGAGRIQGPAALRKTGAGTLTISTTNTYTGGTRVEGGVLRLGQATAAGATPGPVTVTNSGTFDINSIDNAYTVNIAGAGEGGQGAIVNNGAAGVLFGPDIVNLTGDASIGGQQRWDIRNAATRLFLNGFTLTKVGANYIPVVAGTVNSGTVEIVAGGFGVEAGAVFTQGQVNVRAGGILGLYNNATFTAPISVFGGRVSVWNGSGNVTLQPPLALSNAPATFQPDGGDNLWVTNVISGPVGIVVDATAGGGLELGGDNTFNGPVVVSNGYVTVGRGGTSGSVRGNVSLFNGSTLYLWRSDALTLSNTISGIGNVYIRNPSGLTIDGRASINVSGELRIPWDVAHSSMLIESGALVTVGSFYVGNTTGWKGSVTQNAGVVTATNVFGVGQWNNETSRYVMAGGTLNVTNARLSVGWDGAGHFIQTGGVVNARRAQVDSNNSTPGSSVWILEGGVFNIRDALDGMGDAADLALWGGGTIGALGPWNSMVGFRAILTGTNGNTTLDTAAYTVTLTGSVFTGSGGLIKTGTGTLVYAGGGSNQYAGGTALNAGVLRVNNQLVADVTVAGGATLAGTGSVVGVANVVSNGVVQPGVPGAAGSLAATSLVLQAGAQVSWGVAGTGSVLRVTGTNGLVVPAGVAVAQINVLNAGLATGTYMVIDYAGALQGGAISNLALGVYAPRSVMYLTNNTANTSIDLVVVSTGEGIIWTGLADANWNINTTTNWQTEAGLLPTVYLDDGNIGDAVTFNDSAAGNFAVVVATNVQPVSIRVSNTNNAYTLAGAFPIGGAGGLTKYGPGSLTLGSSNLFAGNTVVEGGVLVVGSDVALGAVPVLAATNQLVLGAGATLRVTGDTVFAATRGGQVGPVAGAGSATISIPAGVTVTSLNTLADRTAATGGVIKADAGTWVLNAANTFQGGLTVAGGTVVAIGDSAANRLAVGAPVTINNGGTFVFGERNVLSAAIPSPFTVDAGGVLLLTNRPNTLVFHAHLGALTLRGGEVVGAGSGTGVTYNAEDVQLDGAVTVTGSVASTLRALNGFGLNGTIAFNVGDVTGDTNADLIVTGPGLGGILQNKDTGNNGLSKTGAGTMRIETNSTYSGPTVIWGGVLEVGLIADAGSSHIGTVGGAGNYLSLHGGTLRWTGTGTNSTTRYLWMDQPQSTSTIDIPNPAGTLVLTPGGGTRIYPLTKIGAGTLVLNGTMAGATSRITCAGGTLVLGGFNIYGGDTVVSNGSLLVHGATGTGAVSVAVGTVLGGTGVVRGAVTQDGVIAPGAGIGTLTISNQVTDGVTAVYRMELGGTNAPTDYDQLVVSDVHTLQGTLEVVVTNGYVPASGDRFVILTNSGVGGLLFGTFTTVSAPALDPGLGWDVQYTGTESASLVVTGTVSGGLSAYEQWAQSIPNPALRGEQEDADGDGYANLLEYSQGTDATNSADNAKLSLVRSNGQFLVLFNRVNSATDIVYEVEGAYLPTNNATWLGIATNVIGSWGGSTNVNDNNTAAVHRVLVTDLEIGTNRSLRLKVTRP
jgi:fibronectin-binding autotransporter adhesin